MEDFERKAKTCMLIMIWISMVSTVKQEKGPFEYIGPV